MFTMMPRLVVVGQVIQMGMKGLTALGPYPFTQSSQSLTQNAKLTQNIENLAK